jgi:hypothetical protein
VLVVHKQTIDLLAVADTRGKVTLGLAHRIVTPVEHHTALCPGLRDAYEDDPGKPRRPASQTSGVSQLLQLDDRQDADIKMSGATQ